MASANPVIRSGRPRINGTRITVHDALEYLAGGMTEDEILSDFPDLTRGWNCKHMANATMRSTIEVICRSAGLTPPIICTPEELPAGSSR